MTILTPTEILGIQQTASILSDLNAALLKAMWLEHVVWGEWSSTGVTVESAKRRTDIREDYEIKCRWRDDPGDSWRNILTGWIVGSRDYELATGRPGVASLPPETQATFTTHFVGDLNRALLMYQRQFLQGDSIGANVISGRRETVMYDDGAFVCHYRGDENAPWFPVLSGAVIGSAADNL